MNAIQSNITNKQMEICKKMFTAKQYLALYIVEFHIPSIPACQAQQQISSELPEVSMSSQQSQSPAADSLCYLTYKSCLARI